jgi:GYF domain 2
MHYHVSRNGQTYGPYTLEDLQRYVASGNVLPTDLAKTDEMTDWVAVSEILAGSAVPVAAFVTPGYANPTYVDPAYNPNAALAASPYPDAPNLHWGLVLLFSFLTCFLFTIIWDLVIALWVKKIKPNSKSYIWYIAVIVIFIARMFLSLVLVGSVMRHGMTDPGHVSVGAGFIGIAAVLSMLGIAMLVCLIVGNFVKRSDLLEHFNTVEPVGLRLNGVMTFFFEPWYFQYHLNKINAMKQAARFGAPGPY